MSVHAILSSQLRPGDVVDESLYSFSSETRKIRVDAVERGDIVYRGQEVLVFYISGEDVMNHNDVRLTKIAGYRWAVSRNMASVAA